MSQVKIQGNASGTGIFTVAAPNSNTDRTLTLPDTTGTVVATDASGNVGIGTSSPAFKLDVQGVVARVGGSTAGSNVAYVQYGSDSTDLNNYITGVENGSFAWYQGEYGGTYTERLRIDGSGNLKFNSGYGSVATAYGCRAWVNFNGTGTVAILSSGNVSSITDRATGQYTVNFTSAMPDTNYAAFVCSENNSYGGDDSNTTTTYWYMALRTNGTVADNDSISVAFFR